MSSRTTPSGSSMVYQRAARVDLLATPKSVGAGTWGIVGAGGGSQAGMLQSAGAQNEAATWDVPALAAGTYTIDLLHFKSTNVGIYTVAVDGVTVGTLDGYAAAFAFARSTITSVAVTPDGLHTVTFTMATKNGSSSAYNGNLSAVVFTRTA